MAAVVQDAATDASATNDVSADSGARGRDAQALDSGLPDASADAAAIRDAASLDAADAWMAPGDASVDGSTE